MPAGAVAAPAAAAPAAAAEAPAEAEEEKPAEKTDFAVKLKGFDSKGKIKVIKEIRAITGLGLKEVRLLHTCYTSRTFFSLCIFISFLLFRS